MYKPFSDALLRAFFPASLILILFCLFLLNSAHAASKSNTIPNLIGMSLIEAKRIAAHNGLTLYLNPVPTAMGSLKHKTIKQSPKPGSRIWDRNKPVQLWYYDTKAKDHYSNTRDKKRDNSTKIGSQPQRDNKIIVPNLMGLMPYEAQTKIWRLGLDMMVLRHVLTQERGLHGTIAFQEPTAGMKVNKGSLISVWTYKMTTEIPKR